MTPGNLSGGDLRLSNLVSQTDVQPQHRRQRVDARANRDKLVAAARSLFTEKSTSAPLEEVAERAGVGVGTLYRHFPERSDLIAAVFRHEIDACADAAPIVAAEHPPFEALARWLQRYAAFITAKRGLAPALHSGNPAYEPLREYFEQRVRPALRPLLESAMAAGEVRSDVDANDILGAVASLCSSAHNDGPGRAERMVALFSDGLRYGTRPSRPQ
jgi:AcrR family transcriptional regulator